LPFYYLQNIAFKIGLYLFAAQRQAALALGWELAGKSQSAEFAVGAESLQVMAKPALVQCTQSVAGGNAKPAC
jgi:hypothetical protein